MSLETLCCAVCHGGKQEDQLLLCDGCPAAVHLFCLQPKLSRIPEVDWYCPACTLRPSQIWLGTSPLLEGRRWLQLRQYAKADATLQRLADDDALIAMGQSCVEQGLYHRADEVLDRAHQMAKDDTDIVFWRRCLSLLRADLAEVSTLQFQGEAAELTAMAGVMLVRGQYDKADYMLKVALTQQKGNHDAVTLTYLGQSCLAALAQGNYRRAKKVLIRAYAFAVAESVESAVLFWLSSVCI